MRRRSAWLALCATLAVAIPARAEPALQQAKMLFNAGAEAYANGDFRGAIQAFAEAYQLVPRPAILFSMAQAYRRQYALEHQPGDLQRAIALYREYVSQVPKGGRRADAAQALTELETMASRLSPTTPADASPAPELKTRVAVSCPTPGARVSLDGGTPVPTPLMAEVAPGKHKVRVLAEGYFDQEREVDAKAGAVFPVDMTLVERPARVAIVAPASAQIWVDGRSAGVAPLLRPLDLSSGRHVIAITLNGHKAFTEELVLRRGQSIALRADLDVTPQRIASYGMWITGALGVGIGVAATVVALGAQEDATEVLDERDRGNITSDRLADYDDALSRRDEWRRVAAIGYGAGAALGVAGLLLYAFDQPMIDAPPPRRDDKSSPPAPSAPDTLVDVAAAPVWSSGLIGAAVVGRF